MRRALFHLCLALSLTGCAGYQLGPSNGMAAGGKTIQVQPFVNKALEPRLSDAVTTSLRKTLQRDGTYKLRTTDASDILLSGSIIVYDRQQLSYQPNDILTPRDYRIRIIAQFTATDRSTGKVLLQKTASGRTTVRVGTDLTSAERQALPLAADDLARNITSLLVDGTW